MKAFASVLRNFGEYAIVCSPPMTLPVSKRMPNVPNVPGLKLVLADAVELAVRKVKLPWC
jgi:hypothetical protein